MSKKTITICALSLLLLGNTLAVAFTMTNRGNEIFDYGNWEVMPRDDTISLNIMGVADFNQDGFDDLVAHNSQYGLSQIYLNESGKGYTLSISCSSGINCFSALDVTIADVNGDGFPDLINGPTAEGFPVLINQLGSGLACNTDLNDDGTVNITDLLFVMSTWGPCE